MYSCAALFSSFMRPHAQAMNEYRGGEMSTKVDVVNVDQNFCTEVVDRRRSESVLRTRLHGRTFDFRVHGPSSRPVLAFFVLFFKLKLAYNAFFLLCNTI